MILLVPLDSLGYLIIKERSPDGEIKSIAQKAQHPAFLLAGVPLAASPEPIGWFGVPLAASPEPIGWFGVPLAAAKK